MDRKNKKYLAIFAVLALVVLLFVVFTDDADAATGDEPCTQVITVVDEEAWTEEIVHPAVYETIHHDAVTETTPAIWANWAPSNTQGPQDYTPFWPEDSERGKWIVHSQGIPAGHEGPDGVYQQGGGNSPFFYRQAEKVTVISEAYDEEVLVSEEYTEYVEHPEVTHEETVEVPCEQPDPEVTETSSSSYECGDNFETVVTVVTTTEYVLDGTEWVLGEPVEETTTSENPVDVVPCDETEEPPVDNPPTDTPVSNTPAPKQPKAVPTVINAGL